MAIDIMTQGYRIPIPQDQMEANAVQEAASGLESVEKLIRLLSNHQQADANFNSTSRSLDLGFEIERDCKAVADAAVSKFRKVISLLGRTRLGHARFRRAPLPLAVSDSSPILYATPIQQIPPPPPPQTTTNRFQNRDHHGGGEIEKKESLSSSVNFSYSSAHNSFLSSLTGDGDSKQPSSSSAFQITNLSQVSSVGKPPLKRKCSSDTVGSGKCGGSSSGRCHCSKKRKLRLKRVVRVPAISLKLADIPPDDYSWRKYGQKPIKGSPHPRGYYKCSSVRGCPARKHVERAADDPGMLVVTYEGEHNHSLPVGETSNLILESS